MAQTTTNSIVPTADGIGAGKGELWYSATSEGKKFDGRYFNSSYVLIGLSDMFEFGFGTNFESDPTFGFKATFLKAKDGSWAVGAGMTGVRSANAPTSYLAGRYSLNGATYHAGIQAFNGETQAYVGYARNFTPALSIAVDYSFGNLGSTAASLFYEFGGGFNLNVGVIIPNDSSLERTHNIGFRYTLKF